MSIIQISKLQVRSGNLVDLPQLDNAEFGWASDEKKLYIGKTDPGPNENIEVLTSYSNVSFSQIVGSEGNLNIVNAQDGEILSYDGSEWVNKGGAAGGLITLGDVSNVSIEGGAIGYVLETDGTGNLNWTPKYAAVAFISNVTKANPAVVTTTEDNFFVNGSQITITNVSGMVELNGFSYFVDVLTSNTFALYSDSSLTTPVDSTGYTTYTGNGRAISAVGGAGAAAAGGANTQIQYNFNNLLAGDSDFTYNFVTNQLTLNGNANVGNLNTTSTVTASRLVSNVSTGTAPLSVSSTTRVANLNVAYSNVSDFLNISTATTGTQYLLMANALTGNVSEFANANLTFNAATGNLGTRLLSVTGNANIGNIGTSGQVIATGNIQGGNLVTAGYVTVGSTGQYGRTTSYENFGNSYVTNFTARAWGNGQGQLTGYTFMPTFQGTLDNGPRRAADIWSGFNAGAWGTEYLAFGVGRDGAANDTGNVTIERMRITNTGANIIGTLNVSGNTTITTARLTGNLVFPSNNSVITGKFDGGSTSVYFQTDIGSYPGPVFPDSTFIVLKPPTGGIQTGIELQSRTDDGNSAFLYTTVTNSAATLTAFSAGTVANIPIVLQTGGSTRMTIEAAGNVSVNNKLTAGTLQSTALTTGANTTGGTITGNWTLTAGSRMQATYADLAEYYEADYKYEPGTVLEFGGEKEVTLAKDETTKVAGVVSTDPAYVMNSGCKGIAVAIALQGRVPVKVRGVIKKGDMMVSAGDGFARPTYNPKLGTIIGKALADFNGVEGIIEIAIGRL